MLIDEKMACELNKTDSKCSGRWFDAGILRFFLLRILNLRKINICLKGGGGGGSRCTVKTEA